MDSIKFLINGNPDIDFDDLEGILTSKKHWTFFGVGSSIYTDGKRQVWYEALQVFITMDLPCDVDGTVHEDDFVNTNVNNIWEYRKYWCLGNKSEQPWQAVHHGAAVFIRRDGRIGYYPLGACAHQGYETGYLPESSVRIG